MKKINRLEEILELCEMIVDRYDNNYTPTHHIEKYRDNKEEIMIYLAALAYIEKCTEESKERIRQVLLQEEQGGTRRNQSLDG